MAMARGAWARAMTGPLVAAGADVACDPFGLFVENASASPLPYNPAVLESLQDGNKVVANHGRSQ